MNNRKILVHQLGDLPAGVTKRDRPLYIDAIKAITDGWHSCTLHMKNGEDITVAGTEEEIRRTME